MAITLETIDGLQVIQISSSDDTYEGFYKFLIGDDPVDEDPISEEVEIDIRNDFVTHIQSTSATATPFSLLSVDDVISIQRNDDYTIVNTIYEGADTNTLNLRISSSSAGDTNFRSNSTSESAPNPNPNFSDDLFTVGTFVVFYREDGTDITTDINIATGRVSSLASGVLSLNQVRSFEAGVVGTTAINLMHHDDRTAYVFYERVTQQLDDLTVLGLTDNGRGIYLESPTANAVRGLRNTTTETSAEVTFTSDDPPRVRANAIIDYDSNQAIITLRTPIYIPNNVFLTFDNANLILEAPILLRTNETDLDQVREDITGSDFNACGIRFTDSLVIIDIKDIPYGGNDNGNPGRSRSHYYFNTTTTTISDNLDDLTLDQITGIGKAAISMVQYERSTVKIATKPDALSEVTDYGDLPNAHQFLTSYLVDSSVGYVVQEDLTPDSDILIGGGAIIKNTDVVHSGSLLFSNYSAFSGSGSEPNDRNIKEFVGNVISNPDKDVNTSVIQIQGASILDGIQFNRGDGIRGESENFFGREIDFAADTQSYRYILILRNMEFLKNGVRNTQLSSTTVLGTIGVQGSIQELSSESEDVLFNQGSFFQAGREIIISREDGGELLSGVTSVITLINSRTSEILSLTSVRDYSDGTVGSEVTLVEDDTERDYIIQADTYAIDHTYYISESRNVPKFFVKSFRFHIIHDGQEDYQDARVVGFIKRGDQDLTQELALDFGQRYVSYGSDRTRYKLMGNGRGRLSSTQIRNRFYPYDEDSTLGFPEGASELRSNNKGQLIVSFDTVEYSNIGTQGNEVRYRSDSETIDGTDTELLILSVSVISTETFEPTSIFHNDNSIYLIYDDVLYGPYRVYDFTSDDDEVKLILDGNSSIPGVLSSNRHFASEIEIITAIEQDVDMRTLEFYGVADDQAWQTIEYTGHNYRVAKYGDVMVLGTFDVTSTESEEQNEPAEPTEIIVDLITDECATLTKISEVEQLSDIDNYNYLYDLIRLEEYNQRAEVELELISISERVIIFPDSTGKKTTFQLLTSQTDDDGDPKLLNIDYASDVVTYTVNSYEFVPTIEKVSLSFEGESDIVIDDVEADTHIIYDAPEHAALVLEFPILTSPPGISEDSIEIERTLADGTTDTPTIPSFTSLLQVKMLKDSDGDIQPIRLYAEEYGYRIYDATYTKSEFVDLTDEFEKVDVGEITEADAEALLDDANGISFTVLNSVATLTIPQNYLTSSNLRAIAEVMAKRSQGDDRLTTRTRPVLFEKLSEDDTDYSRLRIFFHLTVTDGDVPDDDLLDALVLRIDNTTGFDLTLEDPLTPDSFYASYRDRDSIGVNIRYTITNLDGFDAKVYDGTMVRDFVADADNNTGTVSWNTEASGNIQITIRAIGFHDHTETIVLDETLDDEDLKSTDNEVTLVRIVDAQGENSIDENPDSSNTYTWTWDDVTEILTVTTDLDYISPTFNIEDTLNQIRRTIYLLDFEKAFDAKAGDGFVTQRQINIIDTNSGISFNRDNNKVIVTISSMEFNYNSGTVQYGFTNSALATHDSFTVDTTISIRRADGETISSPGDDDYAVVQGVIQEVSANTSITLAEVYGVNSDGTLGDELSQASHIELGELVFFLTGSSLTVKHDDGAATIPVPFRYNDASLTIIQSTNYPIRYGYDSVIVNSEVAVDRADLAGVDVNVTKVAGNDVNTDEGLIDVNVTQVVGNAVDTAIGLINVNVARVADSAVAGVDDFKADVSDITTDSQVISDHLTHTSPETTYAENSIYTYTKTDDNGGDDYLCIVKVETTDLPFTDDAETMQSVNWTVQIQEPTMTATVDVDDVEGVIDVNVTQVAGTAVVGVDDFKADVSDITTDSQVISDHLMRTSTVPTEGYAENSIYTYTKTDDNGGDDYLCIVKEDTSDLPFLVTDTTETMQSDNWTVQIQEPTISATVDISQTQFNTLMMDVDSDIKDTYKYEYRVPTQAEVDTILDRVDNDSNSDHITLIFNRVSETVKGRFRADDISQTTFNTRMAGVPDSTKDTYKGGFTLGDDVDVNITHLLGRPIEFSDRFKGLLRDSDTGKTVALGLIAVTEEEEE